jgi:hypothetical protein
MRVSHSFVPRGTALTILACLAVPPSLMAQTSIQRILDREIDTKSFQEEKSIKDTLERLQLTLKKEGVDFPLKVSIEDFIRENVDAYSDEEAVLGQKVKTPPPLRKIKVATALDWILDAVITKNATYVVMPDHVLITTFAAVSPERKLQAKVRGIFDKRPLSSVIQELSESIGVTVVIDSRAAENARRPVSVSFLNDVDLAGALRVLTEMADLKVMTLDGVIFITTPAHHDALRKEYAAKATSFVRTKDTIPKRYGATGAPFPPIEIELLVDPFWPYAPELDKVKILYYAGYFGPNPEERVVDIRLDRFWPPDSKIGGLYLVDWWLSGTWGGFRGKSWARK